MRVRPTGPLHRPRLPSPTDGMWQAARVAVGSPGAGRCPSLGPRPTARHHRPRSGPGPRRR
eukprot:248422-Alexandrium_andersonii.AAC.1